MWLFYMANMSLPVIVDKLESCQEFYILYLKPTSELYKQFMIYRSNLQEFYGGKIVTKKLSYLYILISKGFKKKSDMISEISDIEVDPQCIHKYSLRDNDLLYSIGDKYYVTVATFNGAIPCFDDVLEHHPLSKNKNTLLDRLFNLIS